ncbi:hypothetical protein ANANG_G00317070 [Anguilla anguilla]|uniref:Uncharacterized protein n=1 Tax=Anguilla anguilla TaxID=7936 RepID=A0A9D3LHT6_ANGAN|nr:hypothetical protein ANANG_G00317070 [Anguilla anguilla]
MWSQGIFLIGMFGLVFVQTYRYDGQCSVCLEKGCKTGVRFIIPDNHYGKPWMKGNEEIPKCFVGNLKPDAPCALSNGSLVLWTEQPLYFEGKDNSSDEWKVFLSNNMPCADLDLRSRLTPPSGTEDLEQINATANPMASATATPIVSLGVIAVIGIMAFVVI